MMPSAATIAAKLAIRARLRMPSWAEGAGAEVVLAAGEDADMSGHLSVDA